MKNFFNNLTPPKDKFCTGCQFVNPAPSIKSAISEPDQTVLLYSYDTYNAWQPDVNSYLINTLPEQLLATAIGVKAGNPNLNVIVVFQKRVEFQANINDFIYAAHNKISLACLLIEQPSSEGTETLVDPLTFSISNGADFVAQEISNQPEKLTRTIIKGLHYPGLAFVNIAHPCKNSNHNNLPLAKTEAEKDPRSRNEALNMIRVAQNNMLLEGLIYNEKIQQGEN